MDRLIDRHRLGIRGRQRHIQVERKSGIKPKGSEIWTETHNQEQTKTE